MAEWAHLNIESPQFVHTPHIWVQWKGTNVCCDIHCACGEHLHFDGDFFYFFQCPYCKQYWEVGTHIALYAASPARALQGPFQVVERREEEG